MSDFLGHQGQPCSWGNAQEVLSNEPMPSDPLDATLTSIRGSAEMPIRLVASSNYPG